MKHIGRKQIAGLGIGCLLAIWLMAGCEEVTRPGIFPPATGKTVEVALTVGWAETTDLSFPPPQTAIGLAPADSREVFQCTCLPEGLTKTTARSLCPDRLYNLEIQQYDQAGSRIGGMSSAVTQATGSALTVSLAASNDCQLVAVAWGDGNTTRLGSSGLAEAQKKNVSSSVVATLDPTRQADMNRMPYVLHLPHVKVSEEGRIVSPEGEDVRLLLRRLAVRLSLEWNYVFPGYRLKQILLQSIPVDYAVVAQPDAKDQTYPSLLGQFTTIRLEADDLASGTWACWLPANVRGVNSAVTSALYRTKQMAPTGSSHASFIAVNTADPRKKLDYRVYLGGVESSDFNLHSHTDYHYTIRFNHTQLPVGDRRVTIIDPIPASLNNHNFVPTANCFMVAPGGAFCFDPFSFRQNGNDIANTLLQGWAAQEGGIADVRLLWQTKENGDVGDAVMGVVNSDTDHTNIVEAQKNDGTAVSASAPLTGDGQGRIFCRVASNTTGGSGVIAAYAPSGKILWSWHVWVTDYKPDPSGAASVYEPADKRKHLYSSAGYTNTYPLMDRNLGAFVGLDRAPEDRIEMTKANGFHYQRGRKDPFPGTFTASEESSFNAVIVPDCPPRNFLNRYEGDGLSWIIATNQPLYATLRAAYATPLSIGASSGNSQWCKEQTGGWGTSLKGIHDPCPAGWRIPQNQEVYRPLVENNQQAAAYNDVKKNGGVLLHYEKGSDRSTYVRYAGYPTSASSVINVGIGGYLNVGQPEQIFELGLSGTNPTIKLNTKWNTDVHTVRCMQERN